jgi:hypothetical protein
LQLDPGAGAPPGNSERHFSISESRLNHRGP